MATFNNQRILAIIPARGGSKGVKNKNLRLLGKHPLVSYMIQAAQESKYLTKVVLSTDSEAIAEAGRSYGIDVPFVRPSDIAGDRSTLMEVNQHAVRHFEKEGETFDAVMSLQPTAPFLKTETIDKAIELLLETGCDSVTSIAEMTQCHPQIMKNLADDNQISNFFEISDRLAYRGRQDRKPVYYMTGGLYIRPTSLLMKHEGGGHALGDDSRAVVLDPIEAVDIDTELDYVVANTLLEKGYVR